MSPFDQRIINTKSKHWFLADAIGALVTASMLGIVLPAFDDLIGLSLSTLFLLTAAAIVFFCYSLACYFLVSAKWWLFLRIIAFANLSYCLWTSWLVIEHWSQLTKVDVLYFVGELIVVAIIAFLELKKAQISKKTNVY